MLWIIYVLDNTHSIQNSIAQGETKEKTEYKKDSVAQIF